MLDRSRWAALLIGTSQSADPAIGTSAPAILDNIKTLAKVLRDPAAVGIPAGSVIIVADPDDPGAVLAPLNKLASADLNVLLVYYSGHGVIDRDGLLHLSLIGTTRDNLNWHSVRSNCQDLWISGLRSLLEQRGEEPVVGGINVDGHPLAQVLIFLVVEPSSGDR